MISVFNNNKETNNPVNYSVDDVLEGIRLAYLNDEIAKIRAEYDDKTRHALKANLPCICFSGEFRRRTDGACISHSGFAIIDIDHIGTDHVAEKKEEMKLIPFVYACFVSPSGDGLKVLVRIPPVIEDHRAHYKALMKLFPQSDPTSINLSRICYASSDPDIYINKDAVEFVEMIEETKEEVQTRISEYDKRTDYSKLNAALKMIATSIDGEKHHILLKASKLAGGLIAGGYLDEEATIAALVSAIRDRGVDDLALATKTIKDGVAFGKRQPIDDEPDIVVTNDVSMYIAQKEETDLYIEQIRNNTFQEGKTTGMKLLDEHWRFKDANFVITLGHDNVGKSVTLWYLSMLSAKLHNWSWIIHSAENKLGGVKRKLIEFYWCKSIKHMEDKELAEGMNFVEDHYTFIKNDDTFTYKELLDINLRINDKKPHNAMLIDPYNSLYFPEGKDRHEYDYRATGEMRALIKKTGCSIFLNVHAVTEALRRRYPPGHMYAGHPMPPEKSDAEGGGKFSNRADDFLVIHRLVYHEDWMTTQIHVKKIKEMETGGQPTQMDAPVKIKSVAGVGFVDEEDYNPITGIGRPPVKQLHPEYKPMMPNPRAAAEPDSTSDDDPELF